tara:strand:- start:566 stop:1798 length:1233 start_codon:yes stop_codon:yes gene_type:complete
VKIRLDKNIKRAFIEEYFYCIQTMASKQTKSTSANTALLLYSDSDINADMLYFGGFFVPDAFLAFQIGKKKIAVLSALEIARGKKESCFNEILSLEECLAAAKKTLKVTKPGIAEVVRWVAKEYGIKNFTVPTDFPAGLAFALKKARLNITPKPDPFFEARMCKSEAEALAIREGNAASAAGIRMASKILSASTIKGKKLYYEGKALTSERLRYFVDRACLEKGAIAQNTIVAGGDQACDPHCQGSGFLYANELIIVDVFPRVTATGYHGDMTRTFLKGTANDAQRKLVKTVRAAQKKAFETIKAGVPCPKPHAEAAAYMEKQGYVTGQKKGVPQGFFHGLGHGLGLSVHEAPRVSPAGTGLKLKAGNVVTVEPGLYYPGVGGVRIEDVVWVRSKGYEMLSSCPYKWELK